jgi:hypothetical protein
MAHPVGASGGSSLSLRHVPALHWFGFGDACLVSARSCHLELHARPLPQFADRHPWPLRRPQHGLSLAYDSRDDIARRASGEGYPREVVRKGAAMAPIEQIKKVLEMATGLPRPRKGGSAYAGDDGNTRNNPTLPLVIYRGEVGRRRDLDPAAIFESHFATNGWKDAWRSGIYNFLHFLNRFGTEAAASLLAAAKPVTAAIARLRKAPSETLRR